MAQTDVLCDRWRRNRLPLLRRQQQCVQHVFLQQRLGEAGRGRAAELSDEPHHVFEQCHQPGQSARETVHS